MDEIVFDYETIAPNPPQVFDIMQTPGIVCIFTETVNIDTDEIMRFVQYCDNETCITLSFREAEAARGRAGNTIELLDEQGEPVNLEGDFAENSIGKITHHGHFRQRWTSEGMRKWRELRQDYPSLIYMTAAQLQSILDEYVRTGPSSPDLYRHQTYVELALWAKQQAGEVQMTPTVSTD
jgi:hypothetical protein